MREKNNIMKTLALWALVLVVFLSVFTNNTFQGKTDNIQYSEFVSMLNNKKEEGYPKQLISITINDREIIGKYNVSINSFDGSQNGSENRSFRTVIPEDQGLMDLIRTTAFEKGLC